MNELIESFGVSENYLCDVFRREPRGGIRNGDSVPDLRFEDIETKGRPRDGRVSEIHADLWIARLVNSPEMHAPTRDVRKLFVPLDIYRDCVVIATNPVRGFEHR